MGKAVLIQEFMCGRCDEVYWSIGEITDRLAYFEENQSEAERKIEKVREYCENWMVELEEEREGLPAYIGAGEGLTSQINKLNSILNILEETE